MNSNHSFVKSFSFESNFAESKFSFVGLTNDNNSLPTHVRRRHSPCVFTSFSSEYNSFLKLSCTLGLATIYTFFLVLV